jgi:hypothetical protein
VKLLGVYHDPSTSIGIDPDGRVFAYQDPSPPTAVTDECENDQTPLVSSIDNLYYQGYSGSFIKVHFQGLSLDGCQKLLIVRFADSLIVPKSPVFVEVQDSDGCWRRLATLWTRVNWAVNVIDVTSFCLGKEELNLEFSFVARDEIDFIGIGTNDRLGFEVCEANLTYAISSAFGNVKERLLNEDRIYAEILPREQILMVFNMRGNHTRDCTFIFYCRGHYEKIS